MNPCDEHPIGEPMTCVLPFPENWYAVLEKKYSRLVVLVHDTRTPASHDELIKQQPDYLTNITDYIWMDITKAEYETYGEICKIPMLDITEFREWEKEYAGG